MRCKDHNRMYCVDERCRRRERDAPQSGYGIAETVYIPDVDADRDTTRNGFPETDCAPATSAEPAVSYSTSSGDTGSTGSCATGE